MSESTTAVVDRIVDGQTAVLLVEEGEEIVDEVTVPADRLPEPGRTDGAVYAVEFAGDEVEQLTYQPEESQSRRDAAQDRFDSLSERLGEE